MLTNSGQYDIIRPERGKENPKPERKVKMKARNRLEEMVLEMLRKGEKLTGWALDILIDMELDAEENEENAEN